MKYSAAVLSLVGAAAAVPSFLNTEYNVVAGEPFTLSFSGCENGCTITLENGSEDDLQPVRELTGSATGGSITLTLDELPTDEYAFRIVDNENSEFNFSPLFEYEGTDDAPITASTQISLTTTTIAPETTTSAEETTTEEETTTTEEETTTSSEVESTTLTTFTTTSSSETETEASTTEESTSTETEDPTTTAAETTAETTAPDGAAGSLARPMALVFGAVGAMLLLN